MRSSCSTVICWAALCILRNFSYRYPRKGADAHSVGHVDCAVLEYFREAVSMALRGRKAQAIWHLAASSDIASGNADPTWDLHHTFLTTFNALLVMREFEIPEFHFSSSGAIYGDFGRHPVAEVRWALATDLELRGDEIGLEAQICASLECFGRKASIFRFPNVIGAPATHGVIFDFMKKLQADNTRLQVLGNGTQQKGYLYVRELVAAMLFVAEHGQEKINLYNIGPRDEGATVRFIAETVRDHVAPGAEIVYGEEDRGWVGDIPQSRFNTDRLAKFGWKRTLSSEESVRRAVHDIARQFNEVEPDQNMQ